MTLMIESSSIIKRAEIFLLIRLKSLWVAGGLVAVKMATRFDDAVSPPQTPKNMATRRLVAGKIE